MLLRQLFVILGPFPTVFAELLFMRKSGKSNVMFLECTVIITLPHYNRNSAYRMSPCLGQVRGMEVEWQV